MAPSFKERAYHHIRAKLLRGGFVAGERLSEEALAGEIGISRTPVREALNRLASEGLATQLPHYGVFVRTFEREELAELYDLREMLESYAAACAALRSSKDHITQAELICEGLRQVAHEFRDSGAREIDGKLAERQQMLDMKFHAVVLAAASASQTQKVASDLRLLTHLCGRRKFAPGENLLRVLAKTLREHVAVTKALKRGDAVSARRWMSRHLTRGKAEGLAVFDKTIYTSGQGRADRLEHYEFAKPSQKGNHAEVICD